MSELKDQLSKITERVNELQKNPSELTRDALLAEVRGFYDVARAMDLKDSVAVVSEPKKPTPAAQTESEPAPKVVMQEKKAESEPVSKKEETPVEKVKEEPVSKPTAEPVAEMPKAVEKPKKEPMIGKDEPATMAGDKKILAGQFNQEPLADLRSGIPLNEKFGIIRTLFKGNASDFGDAVLKLNNASSAKEMAHYLDLLKQRFEWDERVEEYQNFRGYVERRMMSLQPSNANADQ